ncbi:MAG: clostripain-related cysteine peptidase [Actinomycetes bacterium]
MADWSVVIWATVTRDLEAAIRHDIQEAATALATVSNKQQIHVHAFLSRPGQDKLEHHCWPAADDDGPHEGGLRDILLGTGCWQDGQRQRLLVFWGHGTRAFPQSAGPPSGVEPGVSEQLDTLRTSTEPAEQPQPEAFAVPAASTVVQELGPGDVQRPHIVGYDACRMASTATVLTLADCFPDAFFVGSMVPEPASGWPYYQLLRILQEDWSDQSEAVASALVEAYAASVDTADWCMVALRLRGMLKDTGLAGALRKFFAERPRDAVSFFTAAQGADILDDTNLADLGALMSRLAVAVRGRAASRAHAVRVALNDAIIARRAAGSLAGRDGVSVRLGLPWDREPPFTSQVPWPASPTWADYFPDTFAEVSRSR